jgi:hypothetical protein
MDRKIRTTADGCPTPCPLIVCTSMTGCSSRNVGNPDTLECRECLGDVLGVSTDGLSLNRLTFRGLVSGVDPRDVLPTLEIDPRLAGSILSRNVRNSIANFLISPNISPDAEYLSAFFKGVIGALLDRECDLTDPLPDVTGDKSDFALSNVSPITVSCRFARLSENSAATDSVFGLTRPFSIVRRRGPSCQPFVPGGMGN